MPRAGFEFRELDIADREGVSALLDGREIDGIVHLAAQAGVRYSMVNPYAYVHSNVMGHVVMLEAARRVPGLRHFVYASSSSVYGLNRALPFKEAARVDTPARRRARMDQAMRVARLWRDFHELFVTIDGYSGGDGA